MCLFSTDENVWTTVEADNTVHWLNISDLDTRTDYVMQVFTSNKNGQVGSEKKYVRTGGEGKCEKSRLKKVLLK